MKKPARADPGCLRSHYSHISCIHITLIHSEGVHKVRVRFLCFGTRSLMHYPLLFATSLLPILAAGAEFAFNPYAFQQQVATCPGINRADNKTVDLHLRMLLQLHFSVLF